MTWEPDAGANAVCGITDIDLKVCVSGIFWNQQMQVSIMADD